jgi:hypothetical protein
LLNFSIYCGERGIRTPGTSQFNGFQDRRDRPLCHLSLLFVKSECKGKTIFVKKKGSVKFILLESSSGDKKRKINTIFAKTLENSNVIYRTSAVR